MIKYLKDVFYVILIVIFILNTIELIGYRIGNNKGDKLSLGIEIIQLVIVSSSFLHLVVKGAFLC